VKRLVQGAAGSVARGLAATPVAGIARATLVLAAGAGLVVGATSQPDAVAVGGASASRGASVATTGPARGAALACPGPELKGVAGIDDVSGGVTIAAAAAPRSALGDLTPVSDPGEVRLARLPRGGASPVVTSRGVVATLTASGAESWLASATQSLAPGLAAVQSSFVASGDLRSLSSVPCSGAAADQWVLAGGGTPGRQERLILTNPGGNAVTVDVTVHGPDGPVSSTTGKAVVVPAHGRTALLLDAISSTVASPAVHVVAQGGVVTAVVGDRWLDGTRAAGVDDASASATPSREQVIPAVEGGGPGILRVVVPGDDEAVVQARVLTRAGPRALPSGSVTRVEGGTVRDIDISRLAPGAAGIQVRADRPVVAAALVGRGGDAGKPSDFAWSPSTAPITGVAGMPLTDPAGVPGGSAVSRWLDLSATGAAAEAEVVTVKADGTEQSQRVAVPADGTVRVIVNGTQSVWVSRTAGKGALRAGVVSWLNDPTGTLITATPLLDAPLRTSSVGLREVNR
jgi:hypothetical protein